MPLEALAMSISENAESPERFPEPPSIWKLFNLPEPRRYPDRYAPKVDRELLLRLVRKELPRNSARAVYRLIDAFDCWRQTFAELVVKDFREKYPPGSVFPDL
jgi:hypothetical protein